MVPFEVIQEVKLFQKFTSSDIQMKWLNINSPNFHHWKKLPHSSCYI